MMMGVIIAEVERNFVVVRGLIIEIWEILILTDVIIDLDYIFSSIFLDLHYDLFM